MIGNNKNIHSLSRDLISVLTEKAILEKDNFTLGKIENRLKTKFNSTFSDCFEHPEYLKHVLKEFFDDYDDIIDSIKNDLVDIVMNREIRNFLRVLEE